jgi:hypothetical protein
MNAKTVALFCVIPINQINVRATAQADAEAAHKAMRAIVGKAKRRRRGPWPAPSAA